MDQKKLKFHKIKKYNFRKTENKTILGADANNIVTGKIDPS
jgi:hypothetical protein